MAELEKSAPSSQPRRGVGLRPRILLLLLPALLPMLFIVVYGYRTGSDAVRGRVGSLSRVIVEDGARQANTFLETQRARFEHWLTTDDGGGYAKVIASGDTQRLDATFEYRLAGQSGFVLLALTDARGNILSIGTRDLPGLTSLFGARATECEDFGAAAGVRVRHIRSDLLTRVGAPFDRTYVLGAPVWNEQGEVAGYLLGYLDWREIQSRVQDMARRFHVHEMPGTRAALVDLEAGEILATIASPSDEAATGDAPEAAAEEEVAEPPAWDPSAAALALVPWMAERDDAGTLHACTHAGVKLHATYWPIHDAFTLESVRDGANGMGDSSLAVVTLTPESDFAEATQRFLALAGLIVLVACAVTAVLLWWAGGRIANGILGAVARMRQVTEGQPDLSRRVVVRGRHELGDLGRSLNSFLDQLASTQRDLEESRARYQAVSELTSDVAYAFRMQHDGSRTLEWTAGALMRLTGLTPAEAKEQGGWHHLILSEDRAGVDRQTASLRAGCPMTVEYRLEAPDGTVRTLRDHGRPGGDGASGPLDAIYGALQDVSEQRRAEDARRDSEAHLQQVQKMESIGRLAGGIAHDFNNMLTGILGHAEMLAAAEEAPESVTRSAAAIRGAAERAGELTKQILAFAQPQQIETAAVDLTRLVPAVVRLLNRTLEKKIEILQSLPQDACVVQGDASRLQQVLMNLALNAADAMPDGGRLSFGARFLGADEVPCQVRPALGAGDWVEVRVSDTGSGIPADVLPRVFEPLFTTKEGEGRGMGLALAYGIVRRHGGTTTVESREGKGTTFRAYLPVAAARKPKREKERSLPQGGTGRILVVDDEESVRDILGDLLSALGYEVVSEPDGLEGLEYFRKHADEIHLVILDMDMPGLDGRECFHAMREVDPDVRAILATGHAFSGNVQELLDEGLRAFLPKPFALSELSEAIEEAMGRGAPSPAASP